MKSRVIFDHYDPAFQKLLDDPYFKANALKIDRKCPQEKHYIVNYDDEFLSG